MMFLSGADNIFTACDAVRKDAECIGTVLLNEIKYFQGRLRTGKSACVNGVFSCFFHRVFLILLNVGKCYRKANKQSEKNGENAVRSDLRRGTGYAEIMGESGADEQTYDIGCGVVVPFSAGEELAAGAAACECGGKTYSKHAEEVPNMVGMRNGLVFKAKAEFSRNDVQNENCEEKSEKTGKKVCFLKKENIPERSHCAKTASLGDNAHNKSNTERNQERCVH